MLIFFSNVGCPDVLNDEIIFYRFCGGNRPGKIIKSSTDSLRIRFRSNGSVTATGFTCFVRCIGPGTVPPSYPTNFKCPNAL